MNFDQIIFQIYINFSKLFKFHVLIQTKISIFSKKVWYLSVTYWHMHWIHLHQQTLQKHQHLSKEKHNHKIIDLSVCRSVCILFSKKVDVVAKESMHNARNNQPAKSLKSNTGGSFCWIGIQYAMPYSQKYTPPHCFFCNFAGWGRTTILTASKSASKMRFRSQCWHLKT